ncbi:MAG: DNA-directed RNA polymerase subunit omega [Bacteroidetes bacterium]|nr:DNA-directed RNA polymerase subunit omega [Bacteroidota bacterium]
MSTNASRTADTLDLRKLDPETENVYMSVVIISKRANQIAEKQKEELKNRLEPFVNDTDNLEEIQENREQIEISLMYEKMPKPTLQATQEFTEGKTYWRLPEASVANALPEKP